MEETRCIKSKDGTIAHFINIKGVYKMHNWDSHALIPQGNKKNAEYYLFGIKVTKEKWEAARKDIHGQPFFKTAAGKAAGSRV